MVTHNITEDGYAPSGDEEDDDYYEQFTTNKLWGLKENKKSKKENTEFEEKLQDPLVVFGWDVMMMILDHLDARSLALSLMVSRSWHGVASSDAVWAEKCEELWAGKAHLPRMSQIKGLSKLAAYSLSIMDGKRSRILKEDLWDHSWEFHFKKTEVKLLILMTRCGGHECCYSIVTSLLGDKTIREHYVRISRWPQMSVSRKRDWGWKMSSHLYSYSSIPDVSDKKGGTGPVIWHTK